MTDPWRITWGKYYHFTTLRSWAVTCVAQLFWHKRLSKGGNIKPNTCGSSSMFSQLAGLVICDTTAWLWESAYLFWLYLMDLQYTFASSLLLPLLTSLTFPTKNTSWKDGALVVSLGKWRTRSEAHCLVVSGCRPNNHHPSCPAKVGGSWLRWLDNKTYLLIQLILCNFSQPGIQLKTSCEPNLMWLTPHQFHPFSRWYTNVATSVGSLTSTMTSTLASTLHHVSSMGKLNLNQPKQT